MKMCILGFDGFDSKFLEESDLPWIEWVRTGQWGTLWSREMRTAPCWTTILTGLTIEHHGVTHLLGYPYNGSNWFNGRPHDYIFDVLDKEGGYRVGVANFPSMLFARGYPGGWSTTSWMVGGWPNRPNAYQNAYGPIEVPQNIYSDLPDYEERALVGLRPRGAQKDWAIHELEWGEYIEFANENSHRMMKFIETSLPKVDVLMIQESVLDRSGHMLSTPSKGKFGTESHHYREALSLVNSIIGHVVDVYNPEYLSIVSDHGFQGITEAEKDRGCWHSNRGAWAVVGPNITNVRNDTDQVNYAQTILDVFGISVPRDGQSVLITNESKEVERRLAGLGYV